MNRGKSCDSGEGKPSRVSRRTRTSGLLQNMSCSPREQIQHKSPYRRVHSRGIVFALRDGQDALAGLLDAPGPGELRFARPETAERELRRRIDAHAQIIALPAAALVTDRAEPGDERCDDLLSIITVLSKSSGHVYLRDKEPNLNQIKPGRRVVLIVPDEGRQK
jgi:hypothetical protein